MASSHSGEDLHVRTIQAMYRRAGVSQALIATGIEGMPLDQLTAMRLARDGEQPGPDPPHVLGAALGVHPPVAAQGLERGRRTGSTTIRPRSRTGRRSPARSATSPDKLPTGDRRLRRRDLRVPLREVARAYAMLADPSAVAASDPRSSLAPALTLVRDAMLANPEMVGGDARPAGHSLMKAMPGRLVSKAGMEALRGIAILAGERTSGAQAERRAWR